MRLVNETPFRASLLPHARIDREIRAVVIVKATYDLLPSGELAPSAEQVPILGADTETPFGVIHGDAFDAKDGVDLCVLGTVRRPDPVTSAVLRITTGGHARSLRISGDRRWRRRILTGALEPSPPEPFTALPLAYTRAFGGQAEVNGLPATWADNPTGVGFYETEEQAEGGLLPNIEPGDGPFVASWRDRPPVAGWGPYPRYWGLRAREAVKIDTSGPEPRITQVTPRIHNNAHPSLIVPSVGAAQRIAIDGLRPEPVRVLLPADRPLVRVTVGLKAWAVEGAVDGVFVFADEPKVVVTERVRFAYTYEKHERREAILARAA